MNFRSIYYLLVLLLASAVLGQDTTGTDSDHGPVEAVPAKETWEKIVDAPGYLFKAPFWLVNKSVEGLIYVVDEKKLVPKVKRVLVSEDGTRVIMPTHKSQVGSGVSVSKTEWFNPGSEALVGASIGEDGRGSGRAYFKRLGLLSSLYADFDLEYNILLDEDFFGEGENTKMEDEGEYTMQEVRLKTQLSKSYMNVTSTLSLGYAYHQFEIDHGTIFNGRHELSNLGLISGGVQLSFNTAEPSHHPLSGDELFAAYNVYTSADYRETNFFEGTVGWRHYFHVFNDRVLLFNLEATKMETFTGTYIPLYYLPEIGSTEGNIRGHERGRFRGHDRWFGQLEYRYPIWSPAWRAIEMALFVDGGKVSSNMFRRYHMFRDSAFKNLTYGYGVGFLFYSEKKKVLSLELGWGEEEFRLHINLNT